MLMNYEFMSVCVHIHTYTRGLRLLKQYCFAAGREPRATEVEGRSEFECVGREDRVAGSFESDREDRDDSTET